MEVASTTWAEAAVDRPSAATAVRVLNFNMASSKSRLMGLALDQAGSGDGSFCTTARDLSLTLKSWE